MTDTLEIPTVQPASPGPHRPRWRRARWLVAVLVLMLAVPLVAVGLLSARIQRVPVASLDPVGSGPVNYLVVGSDSRADLPDDLDGRFGSVAGQRSDVMMLVHVLPGGRAQILSIPRDLKVEIPGHGAGKVNAAYAYGGPDLVVSTVKAATGVPIHHYVEVDFAGFAGLVDALGGIDLEFPYAARDEKSGLDVAAGTTHIDGATALAYARSRRYQEFRDGSWVSIDANDIGRTQRQQAVVLAMMAAAKSPATLVRFPAITGAIGDGLLVDSGVTVPVMLGLGRRVAFLDGSDIEAATLPVRISNQGGVSYVVPVDGASEVLDAFRAGRPMEA